MEHNGHHSSSLLPSEFLSQLLPELDDETVTAVILHGSYARGDATPPYSDIDLVRILKETPERTQQKRFLWWNGYLLNLSSRPLSLYREWLMQPQEAIFRLSTIQDATLLLDKDGAFQSFQEEIRNWRWEPLQDAADRYASQTLVELSETILRILGALHYQDAVTLVQRIIHHVLPNVTKAIAVQRGMLIRKHYVQQVQETVGENSPWTLLYMHAAGVPVQEEATTIEARGRATLRLYQETVRLLQGALLPEHRETIEVLLRMVHQRLDEEIT